MGNLKITNAIKILNILAKRLEIIEIQSNNRNINEIDLALEDIRFLYQELESFKKTLMFPGVGADSAFNVPAATDIPEKKIIVQTDTNTPDYPVTQSGSSDNVDAREVVAGHQSFGSSHKEIDIPMKEAEDLTTSYGIPPDNQAKDQTVFQYATESLSDNQAKEEREKVNKPDISNTTNSDTSATTVLHTDRAAPKVKPAPEKQILVDKYSESGNSVHERLARMKEDKSIATKMQFKSIDNLKTAIGVNEKFVFVNELFNGDIKAYNDSINQLNTCSSIHEAFEFLNKLTVQFGWENQDTADTIEKFANLVQRRYMGNLKI